MPAAQELIDDTTAERQPFFRTALGRNVMLGGVAAAALALVAALWLWSQAPEYRVLFSNFTDRDGGAITASLEQMGVQYKFAEGGSAILVPAERVHDIRLKLASQGLPKGGNVGFELMENQKLGVSQFHEQVNYQRSLEGELANSIQALGSVATARVHLALPKPSVFVRDQQKPTASVLLNLQPGRALDPGQVSAITHLIAASVPELTTSNVTVVDQNGNLLSEPPNKAGGSKQLDATQLKYVEQVQQNIVKQVESIITPLVGAGNVRAEATADVDFSQVDTAAESYKPNSAPEPQAIRSQQTSEANAPGGGAAGIPGALSNQPPGVATAPLDGQAPAGAPGAGAAPARRDATTNYEVDKTIRYEQRPMGGIRRLTVGVVVNYRRTVDAATGKVAVRPLAAAEVAQINELVKQAMGYSQARGDTLNVANAPFDGVDRPVDKDLSADWWRDPNNLQLARDMGKYLFIGAIIAFLYFRILRPLLRPAMKKFDEATALPPEPTEEEEAQQAEAQQEQAGKQPDAVAQGYRADLQLAQDLARDDPRIVANVVKTWLGTNE